MRIKYNYFFQAIFFMLISSLMLITALHGTVFASKPAENLTNFNTVNHFFTKLPLASDGWTDFECLTSKGYESSRVVFVSNSGNDETAEVYDITAIGFDSYGNFIATDTPNSYQTVAAAYAQLRDGCPDILLLKRGDVFSSFIGTHAYSGSGISTRHIIAAYGAGVRPVINNVTLSTYNSSYLIVSSLNFYSSDWRTGVRALDIVGIFDHQLFEDLYITGRAKQKIQGGTISNVAIRRCLFTENEANDGVIFAQQADRVLLEENVFVRNFDEDYPDESRYGRILYFSSEATSSSELHDYLNGVIIRGNIFAHGERGFDVRSGGKFENNLLIQSGLLMGGTGGSSGTIQYGNTVKDNVLVEGSIHTGSGGGVAVVNLDGLDFSNNIFTDNSNKTGLYSQNINITGDSENLHIAKNQTYENNIIYGMNYALAREHWGISIAEALTDVESVIIRNNDFQMVNGSQYIIFHRSYASGAKIFEEFTYSGNRYYTTTTGDIFRYGSTRATYAEWVKASDEIGSSYGQVSYTDPSRTIKTYNQTLGGSASTDDFLDDVLLLSRTNWDTDYTSVAVNNYIRTGFDKDSVSYSYDVRP